MPDDAKETQNRKIEHINIILTKETYYKNKTTMLECVEVLPSGSEINISPKDVDISTKLLNRELSAPIFVSGMTGGHPVASGINKNIAIAASKLRIPMGVGSQRAMMEDKKIIYSYDVKKFAKDIILIGNLGVSKIPKYGCERIQEMLDSIEADMLALHTNPGQESVQPEGETDFKGMLDRIAEVARTIKQPTIVKEVGNGISKEVAEQLNGKVHYVDVQGAGGTTWIGVETYRNKSDYGRVFWEWGLPTALSVIEVKSVFKGHVWSSGGIRTAKDIVRSIALGAEMCGFAYPIIKSERSAGVDGICTYVNGLMDELRVEMARLGFSSIEELRKAKVKLNDPLRNIVKQRDIKLGL